MGKGNRARFGRDEYEVKRQQKTEQMQHDKKRVNKKVFSISCICLLLVLVLIGGAFGVDTLINNGSFNRNKMVYETDDMQISVPMMQYFFYSLVSSEIDYYISNSNLDNTKALRDQKLENSDETWFDFFMESAKTQAKIYISYAEDAVVNNVKLDDKEKKEIEDALTKLKDAAKSEKKSVNEYLSSLYGQGVILKDVRATLELRLLARKRLNQLNLDVTFTDKEIEDYYGHHKDEYLFVDYKEYTFETEGVDKTEEELATELSNVKSSMEFDTWLTLYLSKKLYNQDDPGKLEKSQADVINKKVKDAFYEKEAFDYKDKSVLAAWAFDDALTTDATQPGETRVTTGEREGSFTVYYMVKSPYRMEDKTRNTRYIYIGPEKEEEAEAAMDAAIAEAESIHDKWKNEHDKSEEKFKDYELLYNDHTQSVAINVDKDKYSEPIATWLFNENRKIGDTEVIETKDGPYIFYYLGEGEPKWRADIILELKEQRQENDSEKMVEKYNIKFTEKYIDKIQG